MFQVLCELNKRDEAFKVYLDHICIDQIYSTVSSISTDDKEKFREQHQGLNSRIYQVLKQEVSQNKGRILEIFGGELWFRVTLDLINRYFKQEYRVYI
jgi:hypothetical protein